MIRMRNLATPNPYTKSVVFYDGQLPVVNDIVEIPSSRSNWRDDLLMRGWVEESTPPTSVEADEVASPETGEDAPTPTKFVKRKVRTDGKDSK